MDTALYYYNEAQTVFKKTDDKKGEASLFNNMALIFDDLGENSKAEKYYLKSLNNYREISDLKGEAFVLNNLGFMYEDYGDIEKALDYYQRSHQIRVEFGEDKMIANSYNNLAFVYNNMGLLEKALEYYFNSLKLQEKTNNKKGEANVLNNIGAIFREQGEFQKAREYILNSLTIKREIGNLRGEASSLRNLAMIDIKELDYENALSNYKQALLIDVEIQNVNGEASNYYGVGEIYNETNNLDSAIFYYEKSLELEKLSKNKKGIVKAEVGIGIILMKKDELVIALEYLENALESAKELNNPDIIKKIASYLEEIYKKNNQIEKAYQAFKLYIEMKEQIQNNDIKNQLLKQRLTYEFEKQKALDDKQHENNIAIEKKAKEKQRLISYSIGGGLALVMLFLAFIFNRLRVTRKQKVIIEKQKQQVDKSYLELEEKNTEILDSINYAKRIQAAILPPDKLVKDYLKKSFILYKPKDIVAGDFYWMEHKDGKVLFAAADCTGHGVPGAMVSVICNNALNRSVREHGLTDPGNILDKTREIVIQEFEKSEEEVKDGMDIALCSLSFLVSRSSEGKQGTNNIEQETVAKLQYAGANNPLWIIRNGEILETKANKQPIGKFENKTPYTTHTFELQKEDTIYIFSDGYVDQFGGEKSKKFKAKSFRKLLLSIQNEPIEKQKLRIDEAFENWRGDLEQIDDVCVIGVKI